MPDSLGAWLRTAESPIPTATRAFRRSVARIPARLRHGSVPAFMADVVESVPRPEVREPVSGHRARRRYVEVSTYALHTRQSGGRLRGWYLAEALCHDGDADVTVVSLTTDPSQAGTFELAPHLTEICVEIPAAQTARETRLRLVTGDVAITDIAAGLMWNGVGDFPATLDRALSDATAAVLVQPYLVSAVRSLAPGLPIVCDEHNDEYVLKQSILPRNVAGRWLLERVDALERAAVEHAALVTATTDHDLDTLGERYTIHAPTAVVPNGVDTSNIEFVSGGDRARRRQALCQELALDPRRPAALFIGSGHGPNIDAGKSIVELAAHMPEVDFLLAGGHSTKLRSPHLPTNVRLLGLVSDDLFKLLLAASDLALNPMQAGSGSNLKLLDYLAAGLPVVSTAVGARGIDAVAAGVEITTEADIGSGIARLLGSDHTERSLAGRHYVEEHCDWRAIGRRFAALTAEHIPS